MHSARSASGCARVGEPVVGLGDAPQPGQRLADDAVAAAARHGRAAHERSPRTGLLADPAHLGAEQPGLPAGVGELGRGERLVVVALGERHGLGQAVGDPVVGDRRPVVLDVVASASPGSCRCDRRPRRSPRRGTGGGGGRAPSTPRPCSTSSGSRASGAMLTASYWAITAPVVERLAGHEATEAEQQLVVGLVPGQQPALGEPGGEQRRPADRRPSVRRPARSSRRARRGCRAPTPSPRSALSRAPSMPAVAAW